tara:strand:- start:481 stop:726 length:246 start_codon:yes stop_codon:yes gene_type:complete
MPTPFRKSDTTKSDAKRADKNIKACPTCKVCWEIDKDATSSVCNRERNIIVHSYYENFPTYGKKFEKCPRCKTISTKRSHV